MGTVKDFECVLCSTKFDIDEYDDTGLNTCPNCCSTYNYDEGPILSNDDIQRLKTALEVSECERRNDVSLRDYWTQEAKELAELVGQLLSADFNDDSISNCPVKNAKNRIREELESK